MQQLAWWVWPLLMCLVLTGIHGYLGIHVLKRKVIFVDLAMAQIAALGAAYAILLHYDPKHDEDGLPIYLFSLGFTLVGAGVMALARMRQERVPQEAFIGIVYASASALAILLLAKTPTEGEQIKHMLVGSLLTVQWKKVIITAVIYSVIGLFHWIFRNRFFQISEDHDAAEKAGLNIRFWDFLFYVSFGFVITSSVSIAGVLLVFSYLVVPGVIAVMFADRTRTRISVAWGVGTLVSVVGMMISNYGDFPTGPSIVAGFSITLIVASALHYVLSHTPRGAAVLRLGIGGAVVAVAVWGSTFLTKGEEGHVHEEGDTFSRLLKLLHSDNDVQVDAALDHIVKEKDKHAVGPVVELLKTTKSDVILDHASGALAKLGAAEAIPVLKEVAKRDLDPDLLVHLAQSLLDLHDPGGFPILIKVLDSGPPEITRTEALHLVEERAGKKLEGQELKKWWAEHEATLRWHNETRHFE